MRNIALTVLMILMLMVSACGENAKDNQKQDKNDNKDNSQEIAIESYEEEINALFEENKELSEKLEDKDKELQKWKDDYRERNNQYRELSSEHKAYKKKMEIYEGLDMVDAQAREIEARRIIEEEKMAKAVREAEEKERKLAEERMGYETGITYDQLRRFPDDYEEEKVKFSGYVLASSEQDDEIIFLMSTSGKNKNLLLCFYYAGEGMPRVLPDDAVTIYGVAYGLETFKYQGKNVTFPAIWCDEIEMNNKSTTKSTEAKQNTVKKTNSYKEIYDEYAKKISDMALQLINEYNVEAASNGNGITGLAELHNVKLEKLAAITTEGIEKMAVLMYANGTGSYSEYEEWTSKLYDVYMEEGAKLTETYVNSCTSACGL